MSGDASQPPGYTNHPKNNKKGLGLNTGILVTVEEYVAELQGHHNPHNLEVSGAVELPGDIYDDGPGTTLIILQCFQFHHFFLQVLRIPIFLSLPFFQGYLPGSPKIN